MTAVGKWDVCYLEVVTNGFRWACVTHPDGSEKVFRLSKPTFETMQYGEAGIQRVWNAGIGIDFDWSLYENDSTALINFLAAQESMIQAMITGNPYQEVTVEFL